MKPVSAYKILFVIVLIGAAAGGLFYQYERAPESSPVSRGAQVATMAGCFACHGQAEDDPRVNFRVSSDDSWRAGHIDLMWDDGLPRAAEVIEWITHGVPERQRERHQRLLLQMPAYGDDGHLSAAQIEDVAAWVMAEGLRRAHRPGEFEPLPDAEAVARLSEEELLRRGDALARHAGCYQCHGEMGQGAVANFASFKGYIPGFQGKDFLKLTDNGNREDVRHWIAHGRGLAIEQGPLGGLAKRYIDQQAIPMPAYEGVLDEVETAILVEFLLLLNGKGPLDSHALEALANVLVSTPE